MAARYDMEAGAFLQQALRDDGVDPDTEQARQQMRWLDALPWPAAEMALAQAARLDRMEIRAMRAVRHRANPVRRSREAGVWPRAICEPAWCQACVAAVAAEHGGEFHWRAEWASGAVVVCPVHRRLLVRDCPLCLGPCYPRPDGGRLRLWCDACGRCVAEVAPGRKLPALWPYNEPAETRACCPTLSLDRRALTLLLRLQAVLLRAASGLRPTGPWRLPVRPDLFLDAVRALACLSLCALWEAPKEHDPLRQLRSHWSPGDEHPSAAAGALAVAASLLASVQEWPPPGAAWNPALLREGEPGCVDFETLCWHLSRDEGGALRTLSRPGGPLAPWGHAFAAALDGAGHRRSPNREEARRRAGFGGAARQRMAREMTRAVGSYTKEADRRRYAAARAAFTSIRRHEVFRKVRVLSAHDRAALGCGPAFDWSAGAEAAEAGTGHSAAAEQHPPW